MLPDLTAATRDGVIAELVDFARGLGLVRDPARFVAAIHEREAIMSTATPHGCAFLHTLRRMPEQVSRPFMVMGRSIAGVAFGAADGSPTRIFFLLGLKYERLHLGWISKLSWMLTRPEVVEAVLDAPGGVGSLEAEGRHGFSRNLPESGARVPLRRPSRGGGAGSLSSRG